MTFPSRRVQSLTEESRKILHFSNYNTLIKFRLKLLSTGNKYLKKSSHKKRDKQIDENNDINRYPTVDSNSHHLLQRSQIIRSSLANTTNYQKQQFERSGKR